MNWDKYLVSAFGLSNGDCALFAGSAWVYKVVWSLIALVNWQLDVV